MQRLNRNCTRLLIRRVRCLQIDLYNILARARPVEQESTVSHRSPGDICGSGDQAARSKKAHNNVMRSKCQTRGVRGAVDMRSIWRASRAADSKQGEDVGGHLARDPLGDEVAMLQAKVQESLQRWGGGVRWFISGRSHITAIYHVCWVEEPRSCFDSS